MSKNFTWYKPEDWKNCNRWSYIIYITNKNHVIFREMKKGDKIPKDCVIWNHMNCLAKFCVENSDMKSLLDKDES